LRLNKPENVINGFIDLGKPWQSLADESFNRSLREERLSVSWFTEQKPSSSLSSGDSITTSFYPTVA
jgi:hypothetical protein